MLMINVPPPQKNNVTLTNFVSSPFLNLHLFITIKFNLCSVIIGEIAVGDEILMIDNTSLTNVSLSQAHSILKDSLHSQKVFSQ